MKTLAQVEKEMILEALVKYQGNRTQAAEALGITSATIRNKLLEYATDPSVREMIERADPSKRAPENGDEMPLTRWTFRG